MNAPHVVLGAAVLGIVCLGMTAALALGVNGKDVVLAAVSVLGGFIGGVGTAKALS